MSRCLRKCGTYFFFCSSRQRKLKLRWETLIGYESRKCTHPVQSGILGCHKSIPVKLKHIPPSLQVPSYNCSRAWNLAGPVHSFPLQGCYMSATTQARLHGVLGRTSMYETFWRKSHLPGHPPPASHGQCLPHKYLICFWYFYFFKNKN